MGQDAGVSFVVASPANGRVIISYCRRPALHVAKGLACFASWVTALERDHPVCRWIACLGFYALDVQDGHQPGPYTSERDGGRDGDR
jgi:hypothetical protein